MDIKKKELEEALHKAGARNGELLIKLRNKDLLITELANALLRHHTFLSDHDKSLIKQALGESKSSPIGEDGWSNDPHIYG